MVVKKLLIAGDSFAAEWPGEQGWVKTLKEYFDVTNVAQAGCSEYKILKQIQNADLDKFDVVIISHTNPLRVHTRNHPLHKKGLHENCDLIIHDIIDRNSFFNPKLKSAQGYFRDHFDEQYYYDVYNLLRKEIKNIIGSKPYLSMSHLEVCKYFIHEDNHLEFSEFWKAHKGKENHYNSIGNKKLFKIVLDNLQKLAIL